MKMKRIYTFTDEELQELVHDSTSRVFIKKSVLHISLHAYHFADLKQSLCEIFDESINHFKPELGGIVLSYRNIKVLNNIGTIINDDSRIYIDVQADYYIFSPEVGCILTGVVNKKSSDHVGCLVHKLFNVSIPRPEEGSWHGENMEIGQKISFRVDFMDFDLNLPYIRGKLVDSSSHPELTEEPVKKKKKKKSKDKFKDKDGRLDNQHAEGQANEGSDKQEESAQLQNIKKKKKKDKKDKKRAVTSNQDEQLFMENVEDNGESENLCEPLENGLVSKSHGETSTENSDWNLSRDFADISVLACSTQKEEVSPKKKKKKKKAKDLDNVNEEDNNTTVDNSEISQELTNSNLDEELLDIKKKKKRKLFVNNLDVLIVNNEDVVHANEELGVKKKLKKHKKHKEHNAENGEMPLQNSKPEEHPDLPFLTKASCSTQPNKAENITSGKTKKQETSDVYVDMSNEEKHMEAATLKKKNKLASNANLQSTVNTGKNLNTTVDSSVTDSGNSGKEVNKRKLSEPKLDAVLSPKKKKSIRFSTDIEMIKAEDNVQTDSEQNNVELIREKINNGKEPKLDEDESSSPISGASVASPFSSSIYSGATMVNSMDRKRKKMVKVNEDVATLKRPINSISPSLISSTRALLQNITESNIKDPTVVGLSSPPNSQESFQDIRSPQGKSGSEHDSLSSSPPKPLTQKESASSHSRRDTNISEDLNDKIPASEPLDISNLIARLYPSENTVAQKQEQASKSPKADKEKKNKKKKVEIDSKGDSQPAKLTTTGNTGEKSKENASAGIMSKINATELPNISELIARLNSGEAGAEKQEVSLTSPKADKDKKNKTKKNEVKDDSPKSKHKEHKKSISPKSKHKEHKKSKAKDKSKKEKDKKKREPKISKEKEKTKQENDLTDLSRKLLHNFLKKQNSN